METFQQLASFTYEKTLIEKYKSTRTGITVCLVQAQGPLVNGYFALSTEAHDDDGLPHTLEHLVFMGSEDYPYKGVLDLMANRCLAQGTNAWTDTDHTCYTLTTAGAEGFLNILPVYLDHILYPTITDSAYLTEVHHITGDGEDAGVVYCEMQARENTGDSRCHLTMLRHMYPGECGYKSETGGLMKNLRECTATKVRNYHRDFYRPENLCVIVAGQTDPAAVFNALRQYEDKIVAKGPLPSHVRPWASPIPALESTVRETVLFPSDEEDTGLVLVAWRGPKWMDFDGQTALRTLWTYLTQSAISPLNKEFVEIPDPYCSKVRYSFIENQEACLYVSFDNVPKSKLTLIEPKLFEVLNRIAVEGIDESRMRELLYQRRLKHMNLYECNAGEAAAGVLITDFLYGSETSLKSQIQELERYEALSQRPSSWWVQLLSDSMLNGKPFVAIVGEPSKAFGEQMRQTEQERVDSQIASLGPERLAQLGTDLESAAENNGIEPPAGVIERLSVPNVENIPFIPIHPIRNHRQPLNLTPPDNVRLDLSDIPFFMQVDHLQTSFVTVSAIYDTSSLSTGLRLYLPLFCSVLFQLPLVRNGVTLSHEDVIKELQAETVTYSADIGISGGIFSCGEMGQAIVLTVKMESSRYSKAVQWIQEIMTQSQFTVERLKIVASKLINDITSSKRSGSAVGVAGLRCLTFDANQSNAAVVTFGKQNRFLTELVAKLEDTESAKRILADLNQLRTELGRLENLKVQVACDVTSVSDIKGPWMNQAVGSTQTAKEAPIPFASTLLNKSLTDAEPATCTKKGLGMGSIESAFLFQAVRGIDSFDSEDLVPMMVLIEYLTACEGPMWREIRGRGYSYSYNMHLKPEDGLLYFTLARSTDVVNAYKAARGIVQRFINGEDTFDPLGLEAAISSMLFEIIGRESNLPSARVQSLLNYFRGLSHDHNKQLLQKIQRVTVSDLQRVLNKYLPALFDSNSAHLMLTANSAKFNGFVSEFKSLGVEITPAASMDELFA
eukprot:GILK01004087.1.p1 GENE.GILK01004087.1~~GILK01004087.1.p1  ORF type:complete len:1022 (-),score=207.76 GILK01004087.1:87-3122(-)